MIRRIAITGVALLALAGMSALAAENPGAASSASRQAGYPQKGKGGAMAPAISGSVPQPTEAQSPEWRRKGYDAWKAQSDMAPASGGAAGPIGNATGQVTSGRVAGTPANPLFEGTAGSGANPLARSDLGAAQTQNNPYFRDNGLQGDMVPGN
jgi:hypothetical protein